MSVKTVRSASSPSSGKDRMGFRYVSPAFSTSQPSIPENSSGSPSNSRARYKLKNQNSPNRMRFRSSSSQLCQSNLAGDLEERFGRLSGKRNSGDNLFNVIVDQNGQNMSNNSILTSINLLEQLVAEEWNSQYEVKGRLQDVITLLQNIAAENRAQEIERDILQKVVSDSRESAREVLDTWISSDFSNKLWGGRASATQSNGLRSSIIASRSSSTPPEDLERFVKLLESHSGSVNSNVLNVNDDYDDNGEFSHSRARRRSFSVNQVDPINEEDSRENIQIGSFITNHKVLRMLLRCTTFEFDIFEFNDVCVGSPLSTLMMYLFHNLNFGEKFHMNEVIYQNFFTMVEAGYNIVPYHNNIHAADVVQNTLCFIANSDLTKYVSNEDVFSMLVAAAIHDLGHRGKNNQFEVESMSGLAVRYNDQSVLEHYHLASAFRLMQSSEADILHSFTRSTRKSIRESIIKMVLGTDMKHHFHYVAQLQGTIESHKLNNTWFSTTNAKDRDILMISAVHSADIANPCKPIHIAKQWTARMQEEWFVQGDCEKELGLPVSASMDRSNPNTEESQVGFISFILVPLYKTWTSAVEGIDIYFQQLETNLEYWKKQAESKKILKD